MGGLPAILGPGLDAVLCGTVVGKGSESRGPYYAGQGNDFWNLLYQSGLTDELLAPDRDCELIGHGLGVTDLAQGMSQSHDRGLREKYDLPGLVRVVAEYDPRFLAFTSLEAARAAAGYVGARRPTLGLQPWSFAGCNVYVLPSPSGANRRRDYQGKPTRLHWWADFARLLFKGEGLGESS
jgi:TDG/mug DNA glycosylase family protein